MLNLKDLLLEKKIIAIVRGTYGEDLKNLATALYKGGIRFIEVTFDQKDPQCLEKTSAAIRLLCSLKLEDCSEPLWAGAGTVLTCEQVQVAYEAGAKYIVSPNTNAKVVARTKALGMLSIPGAMTPTEILNAHELGADFVKLFPTASLGFSYVKDLMSPISHVNLLATAGITEENFAAYLNLGIKGAGISGRLTDKALIAAGDWSEFTRRAQKFVEIANSPLKKL